jgi:hypothetical protein
MLANGSIFDPSSAQIVILIVTTGMLGAFWAAQVQKDGLSVF